MLQAYFDGQATCIQSRWRGLYSRKYVHSMAARRTYLQAAHARAEGVPHILELISKFAGPGCVRPLETPSSAADSKLNAHVHSSRPLVDVFALSAEVRRMARDEAAAAEAHAAEQAAAARRAQFTKQAGRIHNLVSTGAQAGILRPPEAVATGTLPRPGGQTLEEHIRARHLDQVRA